MKITVEKTSKGGKLKWLVCTDAGILLASWARKKDALDFAKLVRRGRIRCERFSPEGLYALILVEGQVVFDAIRPVTVCRDVETAQDIKNLYHRAKGQFILNEFTHVEKGAFLDE